MNKEYEVVELNVGNNGINGVIFYKDNYFDFLPASDCSNNYEILDGDNILIDAEYEVLQNSLSEHLEGLYNELWQDKEVDGWYHGNIYIDEGQELTEEMYEEYIDPEMITYPMAESIILEGSKTGEAVNISALDEYWSDIVKESAMDNDYISIDGGELSLTLNCDCNLKGISVDFRNLSEVSQEKLIDDFSNGCKQGEICEYFENIFEAKDQLGIDIENVLEIYDIDLDEYLYTAEIEIEGPSLDEKLQAADEKVNKTVKDNDEKEFER